MKTGTFVILATDYEGVTKVRVSEIDIKIYTPGSPSRWETPWGLTAVSGTFKGDVDGEEKILNLMDCVKYSNSAFSSLNRAWTKYQKEKIESDEKWEEYKDLARELRG